MHASRQTHTCVRSYQPFKQLLPGPRRHCTTPCALAWRNVSHCNISRQHRRVGQRCWRDPGRRRWRRGGRARAGRRGRRRWRPWRPRWTGAGGGVRRRGAGGRAGRRGRRRGRVVGRAGIHLREHLWKLGKLACGEVGRPRAASSGGAGSAASHHVHYVPTKQHLIILNPQPAILHRQHTTHWR